MKLFWRFFFSIMIVTQLCFSIGSYVLIQSNFQNSLNREVDYLYNENDTVYYLFYDDFYKLVNNGIIYNDEEYFHHQLFTLLSYQTLKNQISFSISDNQELIFENNMDIECQNDIKDELTINQRGYSVIENENHHYIYSIRKVELENQIYYIDNYHNVDELFLDRYDQYKIFSVLMVIVFIISSIVIMILSWWLLVPIKKLSLATKQLANQQYDVDLPVNSQDEIGMLSKDFLNMANQIKENIQQLQEYNQRQELFIANFTHELKTPLTSIIGYGDMIRSKKISEEDLILSAHHIVSEGKRLETISKKLMNLLVLRKDEFVFNDVSAKIFFYDIESIISLTVQDDIEISFVIEDADLYIEQDLMKNVIFNVIDNARNAINDDGRITVKGYKKGKEYVIEISDNGKGIEKKDLDRIMEAFYMVDKSRTRKHGGAGLGLAIVKEIVDLHEGTINFDSKIDVGTKVTIALREKENEI